MNVMRGKKGVTICCDAKISKNNYRQGEKMFIYAIVNVGSEKMLKEEMEIKHPNLKASYQRKGFITFKNTNENAKMKSSDDLGLIFARLYGISIGKCGKDDLEEKIKELSNGRVIHRYSIDGENISGKTAKIGEEILDVISVSENEYWLGLRTCRKFTWGYPLGIPGVEKPEAAPSRSYLKMEEAFLWTRHRHKEGEVVLELGSAPGGTSYSLLEHGYRVFGADPAEMSEVVTGNDAFTHLHMPIQKLDFENIPEKIDILVCDVNLNPKVAIPQLRRFVKMRKGINKMFFTLKIGEWTSVKELPMFLGMIERFGFFKIIKATQLPSDHSEIFIYASRYEE